ncbi:hypothetical protein SEVIR_8G173233v4 [Setaria viridis]|uniref:Pectinesterase inhibitor domain-containing protein n=1 Tax=Setaria viridis TaxID=4556 RepID=A0A4U6TGD6_SETVI|nr:hypothetical protein SEVIR_8G173233v2 [Setaria viridis]
MGFGRKVGGSGVKWLLLLAGVLLAVATIATAARAAEEGATTSDDSISAIRRICELKCMMSVTM